MGLTNQKQNLMHV